MLLTDINGAPTIYLKRSAFRLMFGGANLKKSTKRNNSVNFKVKPPLLNFLKLSMIFPINIL